MPPTQPLIVPNNLGEPRSFELELRESENAAMYRMSESLFGCGRRPR